MTVLGDLAQATSPYALGSWNEVADHLYRADVRADLAELRLGYRLPTEVHEVAMRLLRQIAPGLATPEAVRPSGQDVIVEEAAADGLVAKVVATIRSFLGTGLIGVITPESVRDEVTAALDAEGLFWAPELQPAAAPIVVLAAEAAKGLEFDNVVVVEPDAILEEHGDTGQRALYVALTRCTRRLAVAHSRPLPDALRLDEPVEPADRDEAAAATLAAAAAGRLGAGTAPGATTNGGTPGGPFGGLRRLGGPETPAAAPAAGGGDVPDGNGDDVERRVAGPVVSAIAGSMASTLARLVQPALLPEVVDELSRIVAEQASRPGPTPSPGTPGPAISIELPVELVEQASRAVTEGTADSVSSYIAAALEDKGKLDAVSGYVHQMLADAGGPIANPPSRDAGKPPDGA
jgi:hypothetical protein